MFENNKDFHRFEMSNSKKNVRIKALAIGLVLFGFTLSPAHSELSIQEKEPESSVVNQYSILKNSDESSADLHQLVDDLNQRVAANPEDSLAWELLAQIYYNNGYYANAVYAASEATDQGYSTDKLKKILLHSSAMIAEEQLEQNYLTSDVDDEFLKSYQMTLSKIYGEIYVFNYDESLPKPPAPVVKRRSVKANNNVNNQRRNTNIKKVKPVVPKKTIVKQKPKVVPKPAPKSKPVPSSVKPTPVRNSTPKPKDPFSILRQN